jgi:pimeloyl-ACP methyl ester carboxylesterase
MAAPVLGRPLVLGHNMQAALVNQRLNAEARAMVEGRDVPDSGRAAMQMVMGLVSVDAHRVRSPCLVVGGEEDGLIPASVLRCLADYYHCPLQMHANGHMLMIEDGWEMVADGILTWVAGLAGTGSVTEMAEDGSALGSSAG